MPDDTGTACWQCHGTGDGKGRNLIRSAIIQEGLHDADSKALLDLCKVSLSGPAYRIIGNLSLNGFCIFISSNEIRRIVETPDKLNIN